MIDVHVHKRNLYKEKSGQKEQYLAAEENKMSKGKAHSPGTSIEGAKTQVEDSRHRISI